MAQGCCGFLDIIWEGCRTWWVGLSVVMEKRAREGLFILAVQAAKNSLISLETEGARANGRAGKERPAGEPPDHSDFSGAVNAGAFTPRLRLINFSRAVFTDESTTWFVLQRA